ncbi:MAG: hypothetical protein FVQ84_15375 [Planctomycetes bacterium]|nr:hypothetical protein [Planctomycetota bacterium]
MAIWEHAFANHLSQASRNLLLVMVTMPYQTLITDVERSYQAFNLTYSKHFGSTMGPQDFRSALKELDGDFLTYEREGSNTIVRYQNPSVRDFVKKYLTSACTEMALLIEAVVFFEQVKFLWSWKYDGGGQDALRRMCREDPAWVTSLMRKVLVSPPCRIMMISRAGVTRKEHWPFPFETKVALAAEIGTDSCTPLLDLVQKELSKLEVEIQDRRFDRNGLADIMEALASHVDEGVEWALNFTNTGWEALLAKPLWAYDLRPLRRLIEKCPSIIPEDALERVKEAVCSVADSVASGEWDLDADGFRYEAQSLESLAEDLSVDIASDLEVIYSLADELEEESGRNDEDVDFSPSSRCEDESTDDEIASMFNILDITS